MTRPVRDVAESPTREPMRAAHRVRKVRGQGAAYRPRRRRHFPQTIPQTARSEETE